MSTVAKFEVAQLADAVKKAASVAPTKGAAFDKAAGLLFEVDESGARLKATNIEVSYNQHVPHVDFQGTPKTWRIPSKSLNAMLQGVVQGEGSNGVIQLIDKEDTWIRAKSGKLIVKLSTLDPSAYPRIPLFDTEGMSPGDTFASRAAQVAWACGETLGHILTGVHVDGEALYASNGYVLATVPCEVATDEPITALLAPLANLLRSATDVKVRAQGFTLHMMLDAETQVTTTLLAEKFPGVQRVMRNDFTHSANFNRQTFGDTVSGMTAIMSNEKSPRLDMWLDGDALTLDIDGGEQGRTRNEVACQTTEGDDRQITVNPKYVTQAVANARGNYVTLEWGHENDAIFAKSTLRVSDETGYEAHISPLVTTDRGRQS